MASCCSDPNSKLLSQLTGLTEAAPNSLLTLFSSSPPSLSALELCQSPLHSCNTPSSSLPQGLCTFSSLCLESTLLILSSIVPLQRGRPDLYRPHYHGSSLILSQISSSARYFSRCSFSAPPSPSPLQFRQKLRGHSILWLVPLFIPASGAGPS